MRPRKTDRHLPSCVYLRSGSYYHVKAGKWTMIGSDLPSALKAYAKILSAPKDKMPALVERYIEQLSVAPATKRSYISAKNHLVKILVDMEPQEITAQDVRRIIACYKKQPGVANSLKKVLVGSLELAFEEERVERNVARDVMSLKTVARDRYITDDEYSRLYSKASELMQMIMDMLYLTGQRIGDVLSIRYADISEDGITFKQEKTGARLLVSWTPDLAQTVSKARTYHQSVKGLTLFHDHAGKKYRYERIRDQWETVCKRAGVENAHLHDIRAKAATDAKKQGMNSQVLLGHTTESSHRRYLRNKETPVTPALSFRKLQNKTG